MVKELVIFGAGAAVGFVAACKFYDVDPKQFTDAAYNTAVSKIDSAKTAVKSKLQPDVDFTDHEEPVDDKQDLEATDETIRVEAEVVA